MNQQERFRYLRETLLNLTQKELGEDLGVKQQTIADIENGRKKKIDNDILSDLTLKYKVRVDWLLLGKGEPLWSDEELYGKTNPNCVGIPFYEVKAAAGSGIALPDYADKDVIYFDRRWLKNVIGISPENASIITARGDSMDSGQNKSSDIRDGDLLMVDNSIREVINNQIFVVDLGGDGLVVKKISKEWDGKVILCPNNPKYPDIIPTNEAMIIGRVVWNGSKENI